MPFVEDIADALDVHLDASHVLAGPLEVFLRDHDRCDHLVAVLVVRLVVYVARLRIVVAVRMRHLVAAHVGENLNDLDRLAPGKVRTYRSVVVRVVHPGRVPVAGVDRLYVVVTEIGIFPVAVATSRIVSRIARLIVARLPTIFTRKSLQSASPGSVTVEISTGI